VPELREAARSTKSSPGADAIVTIRRVHARSFP
jgi:hypothetical protein